jgi:prepilin-type N-terminal cleavage/methylation domain-containing protein
MKKKNFKKNTQSGFTIIETLVAIFILLISITGPMTFAQSGLRASFVARDQIVAFYLAQDAIETIKNTRDNNSLSGADWLQDLATCVDAGSSSLGTPCEIETVHAGTDIKAVRSCGNSEDDMCPLMKYNPDYKEFRLSTDNTLGNTLSKYSRTVFINEIVPDREAQIIVVVEWDTTFFSDRKIVVQENIYNWVPNVTP